MMNSPRSHPHHEHLDVHQRLLWFFSFCNQRSSCSSGSSSGSAGGPTRSRSLGRRKSNASRNKFALQYQQQLQTQHRQSSNVFGLDLTEHTQLFGSDDSIPFVVKACTKFIEKHGIIFGIYRLSGMRVNIHKLRHEFDKTPKISMIDNEAISTDAHAVACVLKQYFRELPTPLLTFHMYEKFIELFKQSNIDTNYNHANKNEQTNLDKNGSNISNVDDAIETEEDECIKHDNIDGCELKTSNSRTFAAAKKSTSVTPITKLKSSIEQDSAAKKKNQKSTKCFKTSASDSQLLTLSSVVTTTTSDVQYHVDLDDLKQLLLQLPRAHYQTLKYLMRHLAFIAANGDKTGMDSKNVAIVWAPNLLKPRELELSAGLETLQIIGLQAVITEQLIKHHKFLFDDDEDDDHSTQCTDHPHHLKLQAHHVYQRAGGIESDITKQQQGVESERTSDALKATETPGQATLTKTPTRTRDDREEIQLNGSPKPLMSPSAARREPMEASVMFEQDGNKLCNISNKQGEQIPKEMDNQEES